MYYCEVSIYYFSRKEIDLTNISKIIISGEEINFDSKINNLGIIMTSNFSWDAEVKKLSSSIFGGLRQLWFGC